MAIVRSKPVLHRNDQEGFTFCGGHTDRLSQPQGYGFAERLRINGGVGARLQA
ncbi:MAG: hypothetical protein HY898_15235 [Deltaproteobacteria bacterium]|nr:hypothetical protein [Deltaproteobacteria bacterium]